jgi:hypothetical protein
MAVLQYRPILLNFKQILMSAAYRVDSTATEMLCSLFTRISVLIRIPFIYIPPTASISVVRPSPSSYSVGGKSNTYIFMLYLCRHTQEKIIKEPLSSVVLSHFYN